MLEEDTSKAFLLELVETIGKATRCTPFINLHTARFAKGEKPTGIFDFWNIEIRKDTNDFDKGFLDLMLSVVKETSDEHSEFWNVMADNFPDSSKTMNLLKELNGYIPVKELEQPQKNDWVYSLTSDNMNPLEREGTVFENHFSQLRRSFPLHIARLLLPVGFDRFHIENDNDFRFLLQAQPDFNNRRIDADLFNPEGGRGLFDIVANSSSTSDRDGDEIQGQQVVAVLAARQSFYDLKREKVVPENANKPWRVPPFYSMFKHATVEGSNEPDHKFDPELENFSVAVKPTFEKMCDLFKTLTVSKKTGNEF